MIAKYQFAGTEGNGTTIDASYRSNEVPPEAAAGESIFAILWARKLLLLLCVLVAVGTTLAYLRKATPIYSSTARVSIDDPVVKFMGNSFGAPISPQFLATQAEVVKSTKVLELAETKLKALTTAEGAPRTLGTFAGQTRFITTIQSNLTVVLDPKMNIIELSFTSPYADEAADIVNVIVAAYLEMHQSVSHRDSDEVLTAAVAEKKKREAELAEAVKKLNDLRKTHSSIGTPEALAARMTELSQAHTLAQIKVAEAQAAFGANHPAIQAAIQHEQKLAEVLSLARDETAQAYAAREDILQSQQDVTRLRDQADQADKMVKDAAAASANHNGAARVFVFEDGHPELYPVRPHKTQLLALSVVLGLVLGGACAMLLERLDERITGPKDVVSVLRVPILGTVPQMKGQDEHGVRGRHVHLDPMSLVSEAYRAIWKSICFGVPRNAGRSVLVTSPAPGDGKSTTAANLAIAMHQSGERVLLVDADLRRPIQHLTFGLLNRTGLSNVLSGQCPVHQAIQKSTVKGLDVLTSGPTPSNPAEVLRRSSFELLLEQVAGEYDRVVVDSPPVTTVSDTLTLAAMCDVTVLTVRAGKSTRGIAAAARDSLLSVGANLLGVVINASSGSRSGYSSYVGRGQAASFRLPYVANAPKAIGAAGNGIGTGSNGIGNGHSGTNGTAAVAAGVVVTSTVEAPVEAVTRPYRKHVDRDAF